MDERTPLGRPFPYVIARTPPALDFPSFARKLIPGYLDQRGLRGVARARQPAATTLPSHPNLPMHRHPYSPLLQ